MRYTALLTILMGAVIACFAGVRYATEGSDSADNPLVLGLVLPLVFAAGLVVAGTALCFVGRRGYIVAGPASGRNSPGASGW